MEKHIELIDEYLDLIHKDLPKKSLVNEPNIIILDDKDVDMPIIVEEVKPPTEIKIPLDMKILKQRMDSVEVVKYYKDLKNDKIRSNNIQIEQNDDELFEMVQKASSSKPWPKLDNYTKRQKITTFVNSLEKAGLIENRQEVLTELMELLQNKKITKKILELDPNTNEITMLSKYSLILTSD